VGQVYLKSFLLTREHLTELLRIASFVPVLTGNNLVALLLAVLMGYCLGAMQLFSMAIIVSAIVVILIVGKFIGPKGK